MSKLETVQKKLVKIDKYFSLLQKVLLLIIYIYIYLTLVNQKIFKNNIYGLASMVLLVIITIFRIVINLNIIKLFVKYLKKYSNKITKFLNIDWTDNVNTIFIIANIILSVLIKSRGRSLFHFNFQDEDKQDSIKQSIKTMLFIQMIVVGLIVLVYIFKLFKKKKESDFDKLLKIVNNTNITQKDMKLFYKYSKKGVDLYKLKNKIQSNLSSSLMKLLKGKKLSPELRQQLKSIENQMLKAKLKMEKKLKK
jgi:hypothetical protein